MSKKHKKRTKRYSGEDAKRPESHTSDAPIVHHFEAVERSKFGEWWQAKKRLVKVVAIILAVLGSGTWLLSELFRIIF